MFKAILDWVAGTPTPRPPHVEVKPGRNHKWYVSTVGANGEIIGPSQGYATKSNAVRAAQARIDHAPRALIIKEAPTKS